MMTRREGSSTASPARTRAYARLPSTLIADTALGTCSISPTNDARTRRTSSSVTPTVGRVSTGSPSASSVVVLTPSRMVASYRLSASVRCPRSLVARPTPSTSTPVAIGSRVPAWPTFRVPASRRIRATTSCDVMPPGLSTTTSPFQPVGSEVTGSEVLVVEVVDLARLLVGVGLAGVRRATPGSDLLVLRLRTSEHLVEVARALGQRVGDEGQRGCVPHPELLGDLRAEQPLGRLQS